MVTYEIIESDPPIPVMSVVHTIRCRRVSELNTTYVEWTSDYSRDASADVLSDSRFKKLDFFKDLQKAINKKQKKNWLPLECNPELMNKYVRQLGVDGPYAFVDIYGIDDDMLGMVPQPVLAVLLLFPVSPASEAHRKEEEKTLARDGQNVGAGVYFTKQTVGNACGTVGLVHAILNNSQHLTFEKNKFFSNFLLETKTMTPQQRALALEENKDIEVEHQAVAAEAKSDANHPINDNLHFNAFVCVDGCLYELDGRKQRPINHGPTAQHTLLKDAVNVIKKFIARDSRGMLFCMAALAPLEV